MSSIHLHVWNNHCNMIQFESIGVPPPYLDENNLGAFQFRVITTISRYWQLKIKKSSSRQLKVVKDIFIIRRRPLASLPMHRAEIQWLKTHLKHNIEFWHCFLFSLCVFKCCWVDYWSRRDAGREVSCWIFSFPYCPPLKTIPRNSTGLKLLAYT